jgi:hypothetical protein
MLLLETEHVVERWAAPEPSGPRGWRRLCTERVLVFAIAAAIYIAVAVYLIVVNDVIFPDALSRVGNAQYVLASRDRHLAAIGFVWNPLPSLVLLPFIPLRAVWPALISTGLVGAIASALFMAGAVGVIRRTLQDAGLGQVARLTLTAVFALHPMIVLYGGNGESEAALLFFVALAIRFLVAWLGQPSTRWLTALGFALGGGYLTRYEALAPGLAVLLLVPAVSVCRAFGSWRERRAAALADLAVVGLPFVFTFVGWAVVSRVIVKQWFPTLQSDYGNTAQVAINRKFIGDAVGHSLRARTEYASQQILGLEPALAVLLVLALVMLMLRRDLRLVAPVAIAGAVLSFDAFAFLSGTSFGWLRFQIASVPLTVLLAGLLVATLPRGRWVRGVAVVLALALTAPAIVTSTYTLFDRRLAREEAKPLRSVLRPASLSTVEKSQLRHFDVERDIAHYVDSRHLRRGAVLTDAAFSFAVLLASRNPLAFVITPDQDFQPALADPATFHVQYLLVPDPAAASYDALNVAFPRVYAQGLPGATLAREWHGRGGPDWRLYRLSAVPTSAG